MSSRRSSETVVATLPDALATREGLRRTLLGALLILCVAAEPAAAAGVRITSPTARAPIAERAPFTVRVPGRPASVTFIVGGRRLRVDRRAPFTAGRRWSRGLGPGRHRLRVTVRYRGGRVRRSTRSVLIRGVRTFGAAGGPALLWRAPAAGATVRGTLDGSACEVSARGTGRVVVRFSVDGRQFDTEGAAPYACALDTRRLPDGQATISAVATDGLGRTSTARRTIVVANAERPPTAAATGPTATAFAPLTTAAGTLLHDNGFDRAGLAEWSGAQRVAPDRISLVGAPVAEGRVAGRFEVRPGDTIGDTAPRAELTLDTMEPEGAERWYAWSTYFDPAFPTSFPNSFVTFTQWRAKDESGTFGNFMLWGDRLELRRGGTRWSAPLVKGVWHRFVYHVKWSPDPAVGFMELFYDGRPVMPKVHVATMAGRPGAAVRNYFKQGLYKSYEMPTGVVFHDGLKIGTSPAAVGGL
jgi:hypothetical protein